MLPLAKFYRAYPELNDYSDEACERMIWAARARRADAMWVVPLAAIIGVNLVVAALTIVTARVMLRAAAQRTASGGAALPISIPAVWMLSLGVMVVVGLWIWVAVRRVLIIRSVLNHLEKARCPYCLFSLTGLLLDLGSVVCPECGQRIVLADEGWTPEDLKPRRSRREWAPAPEPTAELPPIPLEPEGPMRVSGE